MSYNISDGYQNIFLSLQLKNLNILLIINYNYKSSILRMEILQWVRRQTGKLADNVKDYKFYVKNEPTFVDSSTTLILTPFTNRDQIATVPCIYKWSRMKNGLVSEVPEFKGNSFICQPSDIGTIIQAEVTSTDGSHPGTAVLKFGPVKLDVIIKKQIEHSLTSGNAMMNVDLVQKDQIRECQIKITEENIKILHNNSTNQYVFDYTMGQPRIEGNIKEPTKVIIYFNQKYESDVVKFTNALFGFQQLSLSLTNQKKIQIKFPTRALRDNFLLLVKAFNTKKAMKTSAIITKIQNSNVDISKNENFDYVLEIQSLRADLVKLAGLNDRYLVDKRTYFQEARRLQNQIQEIIDTYTKIAEGKCKDQEDLNQSIIGLRTKKQQIYERKMRSFMVNEEDKIQMEPINQYQVIVEQPHENQQAGSSPVKAPSSRGGFIKKRMVPEVSPNSGFGSQAGKHDNIKSLCKELTKSQAKIMELQDQVKQMSRMNYTAMNLDQSRLSNVSKQSNRMLNYTSNELNSKQKQKFMTEIDLLRKKNTQLKQQNSQLKFEAELASSQIQPILDNKSQRSYISGASNAKLNPQIPKVGASNNNSILNNSNLNNSNLGGTGQKDLHRIIEELTEQNKRLKQQIQRLRIQKDVIQKEKQALEVKYKKRMNELSSENSMYKRNQDALNRSQNLSMEMQSYNQQQTNLLKQQIRVLEEQNIRIKEQYKKAIAAQKLRQQNPGIRRDQGTQN